jgi:hypothetical protein
MSTIAPITDANPTVATRAARTASAEVAEPPPAPYPPKLSD